MHEVEIIIIMGLITFFQAIIFPVCSHNKVCHIFHFFMAYPTFLEILFQYYKSIHVFLYPLVECAYCISDISQFYFHTHFHVVKEHQWQILSHNVNML